MIGTWHEKLSISFRSRAKLRAAMRVAEERGSAGRLDSGGSQ
jgi:hypothetical protein